mgnify:CR=1 FL=1
MVFEITNNAKNIIKILMIIIFTYYTNYKIAGKKIKINSWNNVWIIIVGVLCGILRNYTNYLVSITSGVIMISIIYSKENIINSLLTTILSLSINYALEIISIVITFSLYMAFNLDYNNSLKLLLIFGMQFILLCLFFKIKRFKYGITFLQKNVNNEYTDLFVLNISAIILFLIMVMTNSNNKIASIISIEIIIYAIIMFITIKKALNLYYKQKMLIQELEDTKLELDNKNKEIKDLETENLTFKKRSHSLVHQQKALEYKMQQMMMQTEISKEQAGEVKERLEKIREEIYKEKENIELDKTGITEIDDMLKYMQSECNKNKIEFILKLEGNIHQMTNNAVSKEDLEILLADHIKNAIIAINHTENVNRTIMVKLGKLEPAYGISIYDTGAEFEKETLDNLGKKPSTTHAEEGGTGMGFMNTFETLRKYQASLTIEEYNKPSKDNYTKVINMKFDKNNEFKIKTYREVKDDRVMGCI